MQPTPAPGDASPAPPVGRRGFLQFAGGSLAAGLGGTLPPAAGAVETGRIAFPPIDAPTEPPKKPKPPPLPESRRVGFALVGLGRLTVDELLPAFGRTRYAKPVALVSGDRAKALTIARQYGIPERSVHDYAGYDRLADDASVQAVYIVLPNSMHAEFTVRGAKAGKHVLCEKPMATSVAECRQMIDACRAAGRKLMIAYRSQYEPMNRAIVKMVQEQRLGKLKEFVSVNSQHQGDPEQWRLKRALAGGGALPDIGLYCLNGIRFLSGEEPVEVIGHTWATPGDARFREVEESVQFVLRFPSGLVATCSSGYASHKSQFLRLNGERGWAEMNPAYAYRGNKLRTAMVEGGREVTTEPAIDPGDQFAHEIDHFARCILDGVDPHTPGEEGLQDHRVMEAIYASAKSGRPVGLTAPPGPTRGPAPTEDDLAG